MADTAASADDLIKQIQTLKPAPPSAPASDPSPPAAGGNAADQIWKQIQSFKTPAKPLTAATPAKPSTDWGHALWEGIKRGARDVLEGGAQIGARMQAAGPEEGAGAFDDPAARAAMPGRVDAAVRQSAQDYAHLPAVRAHPAVAEAGRIGGNIAATAPVMAVPGMGLGAAGARTGIGVLGRGALGGAVGGAMQPVVPQPQRHPYGTPSAAPAVPPAIPAGDYWTEKFKQVGFGAAVGAAIPAVGGILSPRLPSPQSVAALPNGIARAFRPIYNFFTGAEERTEEGFARTFARQVLDPIGGKVEGRLSGWRLNDTVDKQISDAYDRVLPNVTVTPQGLMTPSTGVTQAMARLNTDEAKSYQKILDVALPKDIATRNAPLTGQEFREARTLISQQGYKWLGTNKQDIGEALIEYAKHMTDVVAAQNPLYAAPLRAAGEAYKMWMRMAGAASVATKGGKFSPTDALRAIRSQEPSATGFATGDSVLQAYSQAAYQAMAKRPMNVLDLMHIFAHRGLPAQLYESIGPAARAAKRMTPAISPGAGAFTARGEQDQPRHQPYVSPSGL